MATSYITGKENWIAGDGFGFADTNRIEGNIDYIRNQDSIFNGDKIYAHLLYPCQIFCVITTLCLAAK